jgi:hypothetical protein
MPEPADLPDHEMVYQRTVETCWRMGIEPPSRERVEQLVSGWNRRILAGQDDATPMQ